MRSAKGEHAMTAAASDGPGAALRRALEALRDDAVAAHARRYFKAEPGGYGEGDHFLGIRVGDLRALARTHRAMPLDTVLDHLRAAWHEERLLALLIMVEQDRRASADVRDRLHRAYLRHTEHVNNWDLVDVSAPQLVGSHVAPTDLALLDLLAASSSLWERRIAMLATLWWTRANNVGPALHVADRLLHDAHDLIHKAVGWLLREALKRDTERVEAFLAERYRTMPRTALRYAIERLPEARRQAYLRGHV